MLTLIKKYETNLSSYRLIKTKDNRGFVINFDYFDNLNFKSKKSFYCFNHKKGTVRGMHIQTKIRQKKILFVLKGKIYDVLINFDKKSKNYLKQYHIELDSNKNNLLFIGNNFLHGYQTLTSNVELIYFMDNVFSSQNYKKFPFKNDLFKVNFPNKISNISSSDKINNLK
tara:strand:- start:1865 stop:2374 length:510 start_codon:yes stop_codon:yes gene_type:complete